jgi:hypothetical protein
MELPFGQPRIVLSEIFKASVTCLPGGDDLPDIESAFYGGATTHCAVNEYDSRDSTYSDSLFEKLRSHSGPGLAALLSLLSDFTLELD